VQKTGPAEAENSLDTRVAAELKPELDVLRPLSAGSAARVYLARDQALGRTVAVKVLLRAGDERVKVRFEREAKAAAAISHPCVVAVHRLGRLNDGTPYLIMQYVKGRSLAERLASEGPLQAPDVRRLLHDIAGALSVAHARGILHRDIRPPNILWDEQSDRFLLTDFGIAAMYESAISDQQRLTRTGEMLGDVRYLSPQQLRGEPASPQSDVYALGVTSIEALTSRIPHDGASKLDLVSARIGGHDFTLTDDVAADRSLETLLRNCLAMDAARRPSAAAIERLATAGTSADVGIEEPSAATTFWRAIRKRRMPEWIGSTAAAALVLMEIVDQLKGNAMLPALAYPIALATALAMIPVAAILAWFHGERGGQRFTAVEIMMLAAVFGLWLFTLLVVAL
jgi:eukaryotic-like serine/threonine-protein kinase